MSAPGWNPWLPRPNPRPDARLRLLCLPYAGGGPQAFQKWPDRLPADIEVLPVNLPGRGRRFGEPLYTRIAPLVADLAEAVVPFLDRPYALFGHSMGAVVAFELARRLREREVRAPVHLFVSGASAPQLPDNHRFHTLPDDRFLDDVKRLSGLDAEVLANTELVELMLPVLRADFEVAETYMCADAPPLHCPLSVFGGSDDWLVPVDELDPWRVHTTGDCHVVVLPGDHFFLRAEEPALLTMLSSRLRAPSAVM
jgi:surfactin synthase thioesterase subunit